MTENPPGWAWDRVRVMCGVHPEYRSEDLPTFAWLVNLARYIAEHEEPPVDPLVAEAIRLTEQKIDLSQYKQKFGGTEEKHWAVQLAFTALKRGMELARENNGSAP